MTRSAGAAAIGEEQAVADLIGTTPAQRTSNVITLTKEDFERVHERIEAGEPVEEFYLRAVRAGSRGQGSPRGESAPLAAAPIGRGASPVRRKPLYYRFVKRAFDIAFSLLVVAVGLVPGLILCIFVARDTGNSPIYASSRVGRNGRELRILKFRSMVADADDLEKYFTPEQLAQWHREHKVDDDPRITKLGAFLRASSIDEFPQFINVFLGQISVVGPRVITEEEVGYFGSDREKLLSVPPGLRPSIIRELAGLAHNRRVSWGYAWLAIKSDSRAARDCARWLLLDVREAWRSRHSYHRLGVAA